jgi:hypothetical protein
MDTGLGQSFLQIRREYLPDLPKFCGRLRTALPDSDPSGQTLRKAVEAALSAECVQCGMRVSGAELLALGEETIPAASGKKMNRLKLGYCARNGCDSLYYSLTFTAAAEIGWSKLLESAERVGEQQAEAEVLELENRNAALWAQRRRAAGRLAIGLVILFLLLGFRHWHRGGTIPFIREPEYFEVDIIYTELPGIRWK